MEIIDFPLSLLTQKTSRKIQILKNTHHKGMCSSLKDSPVNTNPIRGMNRKKIKVQELPSLLHNHRIPLIFLVV